MGYIIPALSTSSLPSTILSSAVLFLKILGAPDHGECSFFSKTTVTTKIFTAFSSSKPRNYIHMVETGYRDEKCIDPNQHRKHTYFPGGVQWMLSAS
jgi:hypothetical protein